ncbi:hypothetical protein JCM11491_006683 [Sporobolomyces phaffii]
MPTGAESFLSPPPAGIDSFSFWLKGVDQGLLHPTPTGGFKGRLITLFTLSTLYTVLAASYGAATIYRSEERPRRKAFWICRLVSRSSGRFIVLNPRMTWSIGGFVIGLWSVCLVWYNYQAFLQHGDQAAMWGVRAMNLVVWFVVGWPCSFAGAQAFLLTADAPKSKLPTARVANLTFLFGGFVLTAISFAFAMYQSECGRSYWFRGGALREALLDMSRSSSTGNPTEAQMATLIPLANDTAAAWSKLKTATKIHMSFSPILPITCLIVNAGGCALVFKLHRQVRESASLLSLSNPGRFTSDDPADWRGPSSAPMTTLEGSTEKLDSLPPVVSPPPISHPGSSPGERQMTTLQNLKRAELDMAALTIYFVIASLTFTAGFIMADYVMSVDAANTWPLAEGAFGASLWSTVIFGPILYLFLLFNTSSNRLVSPSTPDLLGTTHFATLTTMTTRQTRTDRLSNLVPILRRNNSATPMMAAADKADYEPSVSREIKVTVQVRTEEHDVPLDHKD